MFVFHTKKQEFGTSFMEWNRYNFVGFSFCAKIIFASTQSRESLTVLYLPVISLMTWGVAYNFLSIMDGGLKKTPPLSLPPLLVHPSLFHLRQQQPFLSPLIPPLPSFPSTSLPFLRPPIPPLSSVHRGVSHHTYLNPIVSSTLWPVAGISVSRPSQPEILLSPRSWSSKT